MGNRWFNDDCIIDLIEGVDQYNKPKITQTINKKAKKEEMVQYKIGAQGNQIIVQTTYYMDPDKRIKEGDIIDGRPILLISEMKNHLGHLMLWEVYA